MTKKLYLIGLFLFAALLNSSVCFAEQTAQDLKAYTDWRATDVIDWNIYSQDVEIQVEKNREMTIKETIVADFTNSPHHGIIRFIPIRYQANFGTNIGLDFDLISITDENNKPWPYEIDTWFQDSMFGRNAYMKIGDPDITYSQPKTYVITYRVKNAITFFPDHDELYWNAVGTDSDVPIYKATARVYLPEIAKNPNTTCYTGLYGSTTQDCKSSTFENAFYFESTRHLIAYEGLTIVAGFDKGIIAEPTKFEKSLIFIKHNWPLSLPIFTLIIMFYIWHKHGRDFSKVTVIPEYSAPKDITPVQGGTLVDEKVHSRDISATIIDLAVRGFIKIEEIPKKDKPEKVEDYRFIRLQAEKEDSLQEHEKMILKGIFGSDSTKLLSSLKYSFADTLSSLRDHIYSDLTAKEYFVSNPSTIWRIYFAAGVAIIIFSVPLTVIFFAFLGLTGILGIFLSGIIICIFSPFMPKKTKKGSELLGYLKGLKEYIETAEKDRIKFEEETGKRATFEKLLPYALAFGVATKWAKAFEGIYTTPPTWYVGSSYGTFRTTTFLNSLTHATNTMATTFQVRPHTQGSSSWSGGSGFGGGFSGGGFGGGGTRGW